MKADGARPRAPGRRNEHGCAKRQRPRGFLVVMVKVPVEGRVKTRLAQGIGGPAATNFYRHALRATLHRVQRRRAWTTLLAVSPDLETRSPALPPGLMRQPQGRGDLGDRMQRIFDRFTPVPVLIIGSDVPEVSAPKIASAFRLLAARDTIFGPAPDGGYWLVGTRRRRDLFANVRWSTADTLSDTLRNCARARVGLLETLADVDDAADLVQFSKQIGRRIIPPA